MEQVTTPSLEMAQSGGSGGRHPGLDICGSTSPGAAGIGVTGGHRGGGGQAAPSRVAHGGGGSHSA
ncbi:MAG TPA: hypothetical protein VFY79_04135 [Dehalococcoidia bacterium]|nr:hypothetical protein [Dehalococcoidia bacterium]